LIDLRLTLKLYFQNLLIPKWDKITECGAISGGKLNNEIKKWQTDKRPPGIRTEKGSPFLGHLDGRSEERIKNDTTIYGRHLMAYRCNLVGGFAASAACNAMQRRLQQHRHRQRVS